MHQLTVLRCLICLHGLVASVHAADKYTDQNRPYEFGFTIDGEQHRHEKKDENGIIMGEFGFITADGVYHVTVYATDENGNFKILSMKNVRVKPYPTAGGGVKKGHSIPFPPSENSPILQGPSTSKTLSPQQESKPIQINKQISAPVKSCSYCSIPTTTTKAPPRPLTDIAIISKDQSINQGTGGLITPNNYQQNTPLSISTGQNSFGQQQEPNPFSPRYDQNNPIYHQVNSQQDSFSDNQQSYRQQDRSGNPNSPSNAPGLDYSHQFNNEYPNIPHQNRNGNTLNRYNVDQYYTQKESNIGYNKPGTQITADQNYLQQQPGYAQFGASPDRSRPTQETNFISPKNTLRNPKQYNDIAAQGPTQGFRAFLASQPNQPVSDKPTLIAAQMQIVSKDTDIYHRNPGEEEGLPDGLSKDDMTRLLYTFNYTVGFHGHQEEGYSNGAKKGYYYVTGRNGIRTRIDYVADEKGFRPRISQEVLDLLSDDVPKPETEKDEKFGLKGYEFKWIYYPTN